MEEAVGTESAEGPPVRSTTTGPVVPTSGSLYSSPKEAVQEVHKDYLYWTGWLTDTSFQLSIAVIAANWAVFGSVDKVLTSFWSRLSVGLIILSLGLNVAGAKWMAELHGARVDYAESDTARWQSEFAKTAGKRDPWPYTRKIEVLGRALREAKTWLPILAGLSFLIALLSC